MDGPSSEQIEEARSHSTVEETRAATRLPDQGVGGARRQGRWEGPCPLMRWRGETRTQGDDRWWTKRRDSCCSCPWLPDSVHAHCGSSCPGCQAQQWSLSQ